MHRSHRRKRRARGCKDDAGHGRQGHPARHRDKENTEPGRQDQPAKVHLHAHEDGQRQPQQGKLAPPPPTPPAKAARPYRVNTSNLMGRYLVASRDLEPGELIISAFPLIVGPCAGCDIVCLGCYTTLIDVQNKCKVCEWPLCSDCCPGVHQANGHSSEECKLLKKHTLLDYDDLNTIKDYYHAITPLRCLLLREHDPEKWDAIHTMVAHNEIRKAKPDLWKYNQIMVVDRIRKTWGIEDYSEDEIHTICGILEVNAFEVGQIGISIRGLYPEAYLLAHDCTPNTTHTDDNHRKLTIRAATRISKGSPITLSYAYTLQCTFKRREHLFESKFFMCSCRRCSDPSELGTYTGSLLCPRCLMRARKEEEGSSSDSEKDDRKPTYGVVVSTDPLDEEAPWKCKSCPHYNISARAVKSLIQKISDEYDAIEINDIETYEAFLHKYRNVLHKNHYLFLSVKHSLSQLYGKIETHLIQNLDTQDLKRKRDICRDILKAFDTLEPGYSRLRGITLYELHAPLMIMITRDFEKKEISKPDLRIRLKEVVDCLREAATILSLEPRDSSEGIMCTAAKDALKRIRDWEKIIGKI